jgi:hypothetical protein
MKFFSLQQHAQAVLYKEHDGEMIPWESGEYMHHGKLKIKSGSKTIIVQMTRDQLCKMLVSGVRWLKD